MRICPKAERDPSDGLIKQSETKNPNVSGLSFQVCDLVGGSLSC